MRDKEEQELAK